MPARILVVEDEQIIATDLQESLKALGYDVPITVPSGEMALANLAQLQPDLVLMDIRLEGNIDGIEAAQKIQAEFKLPVIFLTASTDRATVERVKTSQSFGYLLKPYSQTLLGTTIELVLHRHQAELEIRQALQIAETERAAAKLQSHHKSAYLAMTAHEFRNPMMVIQLAIEMLQDHDEKLSKKKKQKHLGRIQAATADLNAILDKVLLLAQADLGKLPCQPEPLEIVGFCRDQIEAVQLSTDQHQIEFAAPPDPCLITLDPNLLRQILTNLLSNAIKYSPAGGRILLRLVCQIARIELQVQDWGIGIPPADQTQLFERFHRGQNVEEIPGTGLGLAIVKQCVDLHQGQIQIQSQPQQGTTVFVTLPNQVTLLNQVTLPNQAPSQPAQEMLGQPEITQPDKVEE